MRDATDRAPVFSPSLVPESASATYTFDECLGHALAVAERYSSLGKS